MRHRQNYRLKRESVVFRHEDNTNQNPAGGNAGSNPGGENLPPPPPPPPPSGTKSDLQKENAVLREQLETLKKVNADLAGLNGTVAELQKQNQTQAAFILDSFKSKLEGSNDYIKSKIKFEDYEKDPLRGINTINEINKIVEDIQKTVKPGAASGTPSQQASNQYNYDANKASEFFAVLNDIKKG